MKNRILVLVLSVVAWLVMLGIAPQTCKAGPIVISFSESATAFHLGVTGGAIDGFLPRAEAFSGDWQITITVVENTLIGVDTLAIVGTAVHAVGPHGEGPNNAGTAVIFPIIANPLLEGDNELTLNSTISHGEHFDQFHAVFSFTVANSEITAYSLSWDGVHTEEVPEPATLLLFGTGLSALGAAARRRRKLRCREAGIGDD